MTGKEYSVSTGALSYHWSTHTKASQVLNGLSIPLPIRQALLPSIKYLELNVPKVLLQLMGGNTTSIKDDYRSDQIGFILQNAGVLQH
jgi:hypothetical protein